MNWLELEQEISKVTLAILTRTRQVATDIIVNLQTQMQLEEVAGVVLLSLERLLWVEPDLVVWTIENIIPIDIRQEIKRTIALTTYQQLIHKGLVPGKDFSLDATGKLLQHPCKRGSR